MYEDRLKHGAFGWNELMTTDAEAPLEVMEGMEGMKYTVIKVDGDPVGGLTGMPPECWGFVSAGTSHRLLFPSNVGVSGAAGATFGPAFGPVVKVPIDEGLRFARRSIFYLDNVF